MRLPEETFWRLDPRRFEVLHARYLDDERVKDYRSGIVAACVSNVLRGRDDIPARPDDFFPSLRQIAQPEQTPEQMLKIVLLWNVALGGKDLREH